MKAKLNESLGLPAGKQKLQYDVSVIVHSWYKCNDFLKA
jgi:hypothetical protein